MNLFDKLKSKQRFTYFNAGVENRFFLANYSVLVNFSPFKHFLRVTEPFDVIRANIIIKSIINKRKLDDVYTSASRPFRKDGELRHDGEVAIRKAVAEVQKTLPCLHINKVDRVFIPILPKSLNVIYDTSITRLEQKAYQAMVDSNYEMIVIDPFDTFGYNLYDSDFTNLIAVRKLEKSAAFFDYDSLSIYIIDEQGRLENQICLFDRQLPNRNTNHMLDRIYPVIDAYYRDSRDDFYDALVNNQLISSRLIEKIKFDEQKTLNKLKAKIEK